MRGQLLQLQIGLVNRKGKTMRLIDADALIEVLNDNGVSYNADVNYFIIIAPTIDAVSVVRCKECRHRNERCGMGEHRWCEMLNMSTTPNDFCSYGEREDE